jgi:hypothetical protein
MEPGAANKGWSLPHIDVAISFVYETKATLKLKGLALIEGHQSDAVVLGQGGRHTSGDLDASNVRRR